MPPSVSVIITCFNLERYIAQAIRSVQGQEFAGEIELIVVDDASTDGSAAVVGQFAGVRLIRNARNSGVLLSTLAGIEAASHDLIFFLDGDDRWHPGKLALAAARFAEPDVAFVTHDLDYMDGEGRPLDRPSWVERTMAALPAERHGSAIREGVLELGDFIWLGSAFAVHRTRGRLRQFAEWARALPDPERTYQDWPLAYWVLSLPDTKAAYVPARLFSYRLHHSNYSGDSSTVKRLRRNLVKALNTNQAMRSLAVERGLPERQRKQVERRCAMLRYQLDLVDGRRARAVRGFLASLPELRRRRVLLKEAVRVVGFQLLGGQRFLEIARRRTFLRGLRTS